MGWGVIGSLGGATDHRGGGMAFDRGDRAPAGRRRLRPRAADDFVGAVIAPLDQDVGADRRDQLEGVSSSKIVTASTALRALKTSARASAGLIGRLAPFSRRTLASELRPTTRKSP